MARSYQGAVECGLGHADAVLQSSLILTRGMRALQQAWTGVTCMMVEETAASARALVSAPSVPDLIHLNGELGRLLAGRTASQTSVLVTMTAQVLEDAAFPVVNRIPPTLSYLASPADC